MRDPARVTLSLSLSLSGEIVPSPLDTHRATLMLKTIHVAAFLQRLTLALGGRRRRPPRTLNHSIDLPFRSLLITQSFQVSDSDLWTVETHSSTSHAAFLTTRSIVTQSPEDPLQQPYSLTPLNLELQIAKMWVDVGGRHERRLACGRVVARHHHAQVHDRAEVGHHHAARGERRVGLPRGRRAPFVISKAGQHTLPPFSQELTRFKAARAQRS